MPERLPLCVWYAERSDPGRDPEKQINEDALCVASIHGGLLAVVCDGMGGHARGREASHAAVECIRSRLSASDSSVPLNRNHLKQAITEASNVVHRLGGDMKPSDRPGATCVAVWLRTDCLDVAHVGDSRCYRWRSGRLEPMTRDHSVIEAWIQAGRVQREQAHLHPDAHQITRALGIHPQVEVELRPTDTLQTGDRFLLCSDGLTDLVSEQELAIVLGKSESLDRLADELVTMANLRGGHDNITVTLLAVGTQARSSVDSTEREFSTNWHVLSTAVPDSTEQFAIRSGAAARTLPLAPVDRTVVMEAHEPTDARRPEGGGHASAVARTQPIGAVLPPLGVQAMGAAATRAGAPPNARTPYWIRWLVGLALVVVLLVVAFLLT